MKLYKTTYIDDAASTEPDKYRAFWDGTKGDAASTRKQLKRDLCRDITTTPVDVPTDKTGLLGFLNKWTTVAQYPEVTGGAS